jgi:hypothetical protein
VVKVHKRPVSAKRLVHDIAGGLNIVDDPDKKTEHFGSRDLWIPAKRNFGSRFGFEW